jgi:enoyl-CoA hydratase/carnithine racemase
MNGAPPLRTEVSHGVWYVTLDRPAQGNACSSDLVRALDETLAQAEADAAAAFVLQGEGRHFCTGFDLSRLDDETDDTLLARFVRIELLLQRIANAPFLTVACAHGRTMGAGADLFAACGLRLAHADTSFAFPGARGFGLVLGTRRLAARVGTGTALAWVEIGCNVTAPEALRHGLVTAIADGPQAIGAMVAARRGEDCTVAAALREAVAVHRAAEDARDLECLVRSAARPGLRARILAYVERVAAARPPTAGEARR